MILKFVGFATGKIPKARPSKMIAGAEAERTNELLQMIATAIIKKVHCIKMHALYMHIVHVHVCYCIACKNTYKCLLLTLPVA